MAMSTFFVCHLSEFSVRNCYYFLETDSHKSRQLGSGVAVWENISTDPHKRDQLAVP